MRRRNIDPMPYRDENGKTQQRQVFNRGFQDRNLVCGEVVRVDEIPAQYEAEVAQQSEAQQSVMQPVDVVHALHMVAAKSGLNFQQPNLG